MTVIDAGEQRAGHRNGGAPQIASPGAAERVEGADGGERRQLIAIEAGARGDVGERAERSVGARGHDGPPRALAQAFHIAQADAD